ncbi:MAG TPA: PfkB family carbohydrate kinase [Terriglobia bacterium]|nr:PfkB family carbohydrate kinase [Terriglobia bacterium]
MKTRTSELGKIARKFRGLTIGILGDLMLDELVRGEATRISPEAPVPVLLVRDRRAREAFPGGAGNVASNVAALGGRAVMFGAIGDDNTALRLKGLLAERGIDASNLVQEGGRVTPLKVRIAAHQHQLLRLDFEQPQPLTARSERLLTRRFVGQVADLDALIVSDYLKGSVTTGLCAEIVTRARQRRLPVLVDPKPEHPEICRHATVATPNLQEAEVMAGVPLRDAESRRTGAAALRAALGCEALLITRGGEGMTLVEPDGGVHDVPSRPRPVYDVTGAGDTVIAVMALALAAGASLGQAAALANLAGGRVVLKFGTAAITPAELLETLRG